VVSYYNIIWYHNPEYFDLNHISQIYIVLVFWSEYIWCSTRSVKGISLDASQ